ncbi:MAG: glycosyl transferase, partial [Candidatus Desantisbacteria bacterium]
YTGSSAWLYKVSTAWLLGVRPIYEGLIVQPCLPDGWDGFKMKRFFRNASYEICVKRGQKKSGEVSIVVDGKDTSNPVIPAFNDNKVHKVEITI